MNKALVTIKDLKNKLFFVNKYQRGYRWGKREILSLLDDIYAFDINQDGFYCLQPLIVLEKEDIGFELIDGQQRSTTIYLILKFLLHDNFYEIRYETRGSESNGNNVFLSNIHAYVFSDELHGVDEIDFDSFVWNYWKKTFIDENTIEDTVDNFHIFKAYCIIQRWFGNDEDKKRIFKCNLLEHTRVIWYTDKVASEAAANTFINFNNGKIILDQAELIKALFVLNLNNIVDSTRKSYEENQFADEWNTIEQHLRKPEFWNFIQRNKSNRDFANKITLLLEIAIEEGKGNKEEDLYHTFRKYEEAFGSDNKPDWRSLSTLYNLLEEWFSNRETYHLMGAVVHLTSITVHDIVTNFKKSFKKKELNEYLKEVLRSQFYQSNTSDILKEKYDINELKYGKSGVFEILLLYNIAVVHLQEAKYLFPFDLFNNVRAWNIEHIYAKNSMGFETPEDLKEWKTELNEIIREKIDLNDNGELINLINKIKVDNIEFSNSLVKKIEPLLGDLLDKDHLSNLCLLDDGTNIRVGKKIFRQKREMILGINYSPDNKTYIPLATKQIFQKSITPSESVKMNYWNTMDRDAYLEDIQLKIKQFLY